MTLAEPQHPIRVLIVDDHPVVRQGLRSLLANQQDIQVVAEAESSVEVLPCVTDEAIDVILLDIKIKGERGTQVARRIIRSCPTVKIIILTTYDDPGYLREAMEAGVHGFLLKSVSHEALPGAIRAVMAGERVLSPSLVSDVVSDYQELARQQARQEAGLATEDLQLLAAIAEGASNRELAERFYWSEATVKRRVQEIMKKLEAANRAEAIARAVRRGWI